MKDESVVVYQLLNYEKNEKLLQRVPYISYLDLAIVFARVEDGGTHRRLITNEEIKAFRIEVNELEEKAAENTPRICPVYFHPIEEVIRELGTQMDFEVSQENSGIPMYLLTNVQKFLGAAAILYPGTLRQIARWMRRNFFILPSSIHECILVPEGMGCSKQMLQEMVEEVNETQVPEPEVLSSKVYYYDRVDDSIHG